MNGRILLGFAAILTYLAAAPAQAQQAGDGTRPMKQFAIPKERMKRLVDDNSVAIASDRITVDGHKVGYMYREAPHDPVDSGWRFLAGDEDDAYMDNAANHGVYTVNTIANYDPEIIPFLEAPAGSAFIRVDGKLVPDPKGAPAPRD
ncbi:DUF2185 domain-containing protein [Sphingomonas sp.]|uniref:DUF2185 domain-containing protein n=1 Tax=Sphingomonas sp. TaxID=28214 RepID=UPI001B1A5A13|nr:DUF2185 domain-containing protein [Sphingomonas sp.]MBO9712946.1 DUF2185 domain-containing protein [Sphingomonas sp.]